MIEERDINEFTKTQLSIGDSRSKYGIAQISMQELQRIRKNVQIFHVDLKELNEVTEELEKSKLDLEATVEDIKDWAGYPKQLKTLLVDFKDRFQPPSALPPKRPDDIKIEFVE